MDTQEVTADSSPFDGLGAAAYPVAAAFAVAYDMPEVWAALRYHARTRGPDLTWWLMADAFRRWQDSGTREICHLAFCDLLEKASEWLEERS
jgi:hypothetical protein